jgi:hypothetical protein
MGDGESGDKLVRWVDAILVVTVLVVVFVVIVAFFPP